MDFTPVFGALSFVLLLSAAYYAAVILTFALGFQRALRHKETRNPVPPYVSVIVPARNEEKSIERCIRSILQNDYPADRFDLTVVDDVSTDHTSAVVERLMPEFNLNGPRLHLVHVRENNSRLKAHKKHAIQKAIGGVKGEVVLLTDADCIVPETWVGSMVASFTPETGFVAGPVLYETDRSIFSKVQALEFMGLVSVGAGAIGVSRPVLANGANIGYRKQVFLDIGGYEGIDHVTSGDDELLMQKVHSDGRWSVRFCRFRTATVQTHPAPDLAHFVQQRRRWASKGTRYPSLPLVAAIAGIWMLFPLLLIAIPLAVVFPELRGVACLALGLKVGAELTIMVPAAFHFRRLSWLWLLPLAEVLHVPYVALVPLAGIFGGYHWKGRRVSR